MAATTGSQQEATAAAVATVAATAATAVPPEPVPTAVAQATVVEIPNDDAPPPGWGQWENWPTPAPEPTAGLLVVREDDCVVPRQPSHGAEASSSRAVQPIPGVTITRPEQERERANTPPGYFKDAQAEQALWQEFRDHSTSLNNTLNEVLRIHASLAWWVFQVRLLIVEFKVFPCRFRIRMFSDLCFLPHLVRC
jgi:hypothetical protein